MPPSASTYRIDYIRITDPEELKIIDKYFELLGVRENGSANKPDYLFIPLFNLSQSGDLIPSFHSILKERQGRINSTVHPAEIRGEDAEMRGSVLTEMDELWDSKTDEWQRLNSAIHRTDILTADDEFFIYGQLVKFYPLVSDVNFENDFKNYCYEALLLEHTIEVTYFEKQEFSKEKFKKELFSFMDNLFDPLHSFLKSLNEFLGEIVDYGIINSLSQLAIKATCPGIPEFYQGTDLFDFTFGKNNSWKPDLRTMAGNLERYSKQNFRIQFVNELWNTRRNGQIKQWMMVKLLSVRNDQEELFLTGDYIPLEVKGKRSENIFAFARKLGEEYFITIVPFKVYSISEKETYVNWEDTTVVLPCETDWMNIIDERVYLAKNKIKVSDLLRDFPVACLVSHQT